VSSGTGGVERLRVLVRGAVQGVGFRPFVYRLATELGLSGWVNNSSSGVGIEVEGPAPALGAFLLRLDRDRPPRAVVQGVESAWLDPAGFAGFEIRPSEGGDKSALVLPDIGTCAACLHEVFDPADRRYRYPFTNCTNCGPRFTIIEALPYDRQNTTMAAFAMCDACRREYEDPLDRRFHAQPNACPACGPRLELWDEGGACLETGDAALRGAAERIRGGAVVAVKGLGGFHLVVDARNDAAVRRLRAAKSREEKPFALMFPSLAAVRAACRVGEREARLLSSPEAPIVLLRRRDGQPADGSADGASTVLAASVAPGNPWLGAMIPYTPLHHLLLAELGFPVVATSGNRSDEPICTDERDAVERLCGLADVFLVHDRPITRHVDDSIARVTAGRELVLRRARGFAPLPVALRSDVPPTLAVGAHLKNTVALSVGRNVFVSQHIGDLETPEAVAAFERVIGAFERLYETAPASVACDAHPDYRSSAYARRAGVPTRTVQHHLAHVLACMAENEVDAPVLGVSWDGTGYGLDGTIWGGEFFAVADGSAVRAATFRTFGLPGGDHAVREPRRSAAGLLHEVYGPAAWEMTDLPPVSAFTDRQRQVLATMIARGLNTPRTSSVGRLFDAMASLAGLRQHGRYEGQAAMDLEFALEGCSGAGRYEFAVNDSPALAVVEPGSSAGFGEARRPGPARGGLAGARWVIDWEPLVRAAVADVRTGCPAGVVSARFHNALVEVIIEIARRAAIERVALSGGCFQNSYLTERAVGRLRDEGFRPYWHQRIPPNDGGIALGQVAAVAWKIELQGEEQEEGRFEF
jgi:hydrogenase maturation protein HypF